MRSAPQCKNVARLLTAPAIAGKERGAIIWGEIQTIGRVRVRLYAADCFALGFAGQPQRPGQIPSEIGGCGFVFLEI